MKRSVPFLMLVVLLLAACATPSNNATQPAAEEPASEEPAAEASAPGRLILSTTTSTADSGLLDYILPDFEEKTGIEVDVIAVGTGQALEMGRAGDADVVLVHSRAAEDQFVAEGHGTERYDVMYNDFIIIGPPFDPGISGMESAAEAFARIAETESIFVSRGDESGTHNKELAI